jgi:hypothetical protein
MKRLIACCDGTWNTPDQREGGLPAPTNVVKFYNAIASADAGGTKQVKYYHPGVGTEGSWVERLAGGGLGSGLDRNIKSAYRWLAGNYAPGDEIWLVGFSRGAYTARCVGGMISRAGLVDLTPRPDLTDREIWRAVDDAFAAYRTRTKLVAGARWRFHNVAEGVTEMTTPIHFIGVWDTVGSLGIPDDLGFLNLLDDPAEHEFHDVELSPIVAHGRHAIAMDERRKSFSPTLWTSVEPGRDVRQLWFPGVHGDVGGGYVRTGLSDGALRWMIDEAEALGLGIRDGVRDRLAADPLGTIHDSLTGIFRRLKTRPRAVPLVDAGAEKLHESVLDRHSGTVLDQADYWPQRALEVGEPVTIDVFARQKWNYTGLYLTAGVTYIFRADGEWMDGSIRCGPEGSDDGSFQAQELLHVAGSILGEAEGWFRHLTRNQQAEFWWSTREEEMDWFALVGVIASPESGGYHAFEIGAGTRHTPRESGYLYCFANDAWEAYGNNHGSVRLTVEATR